MANPYYNHGSVPATGATGSSSAMRAEFDAVQAGFDKFPTLSGYANKVLVVNAGGTSITVTAGSLALAGDLTTVGAYASTFTMTGATTVTFPTTGTLGTLAGTETLTNKTINLANNTLTGTIAQFNTACSDANFSTSDGADTFTNKTINLTSNTLTGTIAQFNTACSDADFATLGGTEVLTNKTLTSPTLAGTPIFPDNVFTVSGSADSSKKVNFEVDGLTTATTRTVTIPDASGTLVYTSTVATETVAGLIELATQAEVNAMTDTARVITPSHNKLVSAASQTTTSGTTKDFTGIPSGVRRITVQLDQVSTGGASAYLLRVGAGSVATTGYVSSSEYADGTAVNVTSSTAGFILYNDSAARSMIGTLVLTLLTGNTWQCVGLARRDTTLTSKCVGTITLAGALDRFQLTTVSGDTFDAGNLGAFYER